MRKNRPATISAVLAFAFGAAITTTISTCQIPAAAAALEAPLSTQTTIDSRTLTVRIDRPFSRVYEFLANPANWNQWAFGLGESIRPSGGQWIADSDGGIVTVQFTPRNEFGVVDHTVIRPSGAHVYVPMRLIKNGEGCELLFTLFRESGMTDDHFNADASYVQRDLNGLKTILEK